FDSNGVAHILAAKFANDLPSDVAPSVDAPSAAATVHQHLDPFADPKTAQLVIWPADGADRLAWRFSTPSRGLPYAPVTVVDAKTGTILAHYNAARSVHQANVYPSNPVKSPMLTTVTLPLPEGATTLTDEFVTAQNCIDTKMLTPVPGTSDSVHICDLQQTAVADPVSLDFGDQPAADDKPEDPFAELHLYYHTRVAYDYFRGFEPTFKVQVAPVNVIANLMEPNDPAAASDVNIPLAPFQNAFFTPNGLSLYGVQGVTLVFGQGPLKDYAYDADVIYHEFTHAVNYATIELVRTAHHDKYGISLAPFAMDEGIADYFAAAITGDPAIGEYASQDVETTEPAFRTLTDPDACPSAIGGNEHQDSTLFSGGLWDLRSKLAADLQPDLDLAVFSALKAAPSGDLGYEDLANLIVEQVKISPTLGTPVATQLTDAFTNRGVLPECARILEYAGKPMYGTAIAPGFTDVWYAFGTITANLGNSKLGYAPGLMQVHVPLPENTATITVTFLGGGQSGGFAPHVIVRSGDEPIEFTLSPLATTPDVRKVAPTQSLDQDANGWRTYTAKVDITPGAKNAYVMIVNTNGNLGAYRELDFAMSQATGTGGSGGNPTTGTPDDSDCGCTVPGSSNGPLGLSLLSLATFAGLLGRRRRT
ncbi:MAG TPA: MYXO-CTERM sorting domain-containing protein, partial [Polyangium sp.]|nr:MYXO-CTERM sorting domain-containing protein [Polyangium sp.]